MVLLDLSLEKRYVIDLINQLTKPISAKAKLFASDESPLVILHGCACNCVTKLQVFDFYVRFQFICGGLTYSAGIALSSRDLATIRSLAVSTLSTSPGRP